MSVAFSLAIRGQLGLMMQDEREGIRRAAFVAVSLAAKKNKDAIAKRLRKVFGGASRISGAPIANTIKARATRRPDIPGSPRSRVYSVATYRRGSDVFDLIGAYDQGGAIKAPGGKWLAIPTEDAPLSPSGKRKARPREVQARLQFIRSKQKNKAVLVGKSGGQTKVFFVLVKRVRRRRRINIDRIRKAKSRDPVTIFNKAIEKLDRRLERKYGRG